MDGFQNLADGFSFSHERTRAQLVASGEKGFSNTGAKARRIFSHKISRRFYLAGRETSQDQEGARRGLQRNGSGEINKSSTRPAGSITRAGTHVACFTHRRMQQPAYATHQRGQKVGAGSDIRESACNRLLLRRIRIGSNDWRHNGYVTRSQLFRLSQRESSKSENVTPERSCGRVVRLRGAHFRFYREPLFQEQRVLTLFRFFQKEF